MRMRLLAAFLVVCAVAVQAQEAPVAATSPEPKLICMITDGLDDWLGRARESKAMSPVVLVRVQDARNDLGQLCSLEPSEAQFRDGSGARWLKHADESVLELNEAVRVALEVPLSVGSRVRVKELADRAMGLQAVLNDYRALAYSAVRVETRTLPAEIVRVPVVAPCPRCPDCNCPEAQQCPQGLSHEEIGRQFWEQEREACFSALRGSVYGWWNSLQSLGNAAPRYDASGAVSRLSGSVGECINNGGIVGCREDLGIRAQSWHAQLQNALKMDDRAETKASSIIRGGLESIETDLMVRLHACYGGRR